MPRNDDVRFISSSIKLPSFSPPALHNPRSFFSSIQLNPGRKSAKLPFNFNFQFNFGFNPQPINFITQFVRNRPIFRRNIKCSAMRLSIRGWWGRGFWSVEQNQEFQGLVCEGANALPSKFIEDAFCDEYGKVINMGRLNEVKSTINDWYKKRGLLGEVSGLEILSGGIIKLQVSEVVVNNISIRFLDKTGKPIVGKTIPETILRQLTTKKGQVCSKIQVQRDFDTVGAMGIFDDVSIIAQEAGDTGKVDLTINVVEPKIALGISRGHGGISNGIAICHKNLFGRNKQLHLSLQNGEIDSKFGIKYTDPWIEGGDKITSRTIMIEKSRTPGNQPNNNGLTIGRITGGVEYSRPFRPNWNGTAGLIFQRAGAHDEKGIPIRRDLFGSPLTASGNTHDDMLLAKLETVYTSSGGPDSSMFAFNMDQGIPVSPEWPVFNRVNALARQGFVIGPAHFLVSLSGGHVVGTLPPHEAFSIGGRNSVRGYEAGAVGSGRSYVVGSGEMSFRVMGAVEGFVFADYGTDLGSGSTVPGNAAGGGARNKPGSGYGYGYGYGIGVRVGPLRLEYTFNDEGTGGFHYRIGL